MYLMTLLLIMSALLVETRFSQNTPTALYARRKRQPKLTYNKWAATLLVSSIDLSILE